MNKFSFFIFCLFFVFVSNFALAKIDSDGDGKSYYSINDKIQNLEKNVSILQKYMFNAHGSKDDGREVADHHNVTLEEDELIEQLKNIRGEIENIQNQYNKLNARIVDLESTMTLKFSNISEKISGDTAQDRVLNNIGKEFSNFEVHDTDSYVNEENAQAENWQNYDDMKEQEKSYNLAYIALKNNETGKALQSFKKFVEKYPRGSLTPNAYYWIGEIYFREENFQEAAINYLLGYKKNKTGLKAMENLTKLSQSLINIGKYTEACVVLNNIETSFVNIPLVIKQDVSKFKLTARCG